MSTLKTLINKIQNKQISLSVLADGSAILMDEKAETVMTLNKSGTQIVESSLSSDADVEEITRDLVKRYNIPEKQAQDDIADFSQQLQEIIK